MIRVEKRGKHCNKVEGEEKEIFGFKVEFIVHYHHLIIFGPF